MVWTQLIHVTTKKSCLSEHDSHTHQSFMWRSGGCTFRIFTTHFSETIAKIEQCCNTSGIQQTPVRSHDEHFLFLFKGTFREKRKCIRSKVWHVRFVVRRLHDSFDFVWRLGLTLEWHHFLRNTLRICYCNPLVFFTTLKWPMRSVHSDKQLSEAKQGS